jgi:hypothetical protein
MVINADEAAWKLGRHFFVEWSDCCHIIDKLSQSVMYYDSNFHIMYYELYAGKVKPENTVF